MKLYGYWRSSASWRVRIGLGLKGLEVEHHSVHLVRDGGEQHGTDHLKRNPMRQVPVLELDDGRQLTQSLAILAYLDAQHPEPPLLPSDPYLRGRAWALTEVVNSGIQPLQNLATLQHLTRLGVDRMAWGRHHIHQGLLNLQTMATDTAGRFLVGDDVSLADIALIPQLYNARRFEVPLDALDLLLQIEARCETLEAFQAAHAHQQPDATL